MLKPQIWLSSNLVNGIRLLHHSVRPSTLSVVAGSLNFESRKLQFHGGIQTRTIWLRTRPTKSAPTTRRNRIPNARESKEATGTSHPAESSHSPIAEIKAVVPHDPKGVLTEQSSAFSILAHPAVVVGRQFEFLNIFMGFEQANKYAIKDPNGVDVGFIAEEDGLGKSLMRNFFHTHRRFNAMVMDTQGNVVLKIHRPFSFINSRLYVYSQPDNQLIGEVHQQWHLWRRKYNLFNKNQEQFAKIDMPLLSWEFEMIDESGKRIGMVDRNFSGFMREIFTDTGQYVVRMDAASAQIQPQLPSGQIAVSSTSSVPVAQTIVQSEPSRPMTLDERAVALACAVSIDFDYFSRHSGHSGFLPFPFFGMGGGGGAPAESENPSPGSSAPVPSESTPGGGMGPMPIILPGMGGIGSSSPSSPAEPGAAPVPPLDSTGGVGGTAAPEDVMSQNKSKWGDEGWDVSDRESGVWSDDESGDSGGGWGDAFGGFFGDD